MICLSNFSDTCAYCYSGIKEGIKVCECGVSVCKEHEELLFSKLNCSSDNCYSLTFDESDKAVVTANFDVGDLEKRINIKINNGMQCSFSSKECTHVYDSLNISLDLEKKELKCSECELTENIWICLDCGYMGCGRKQPGIAGNGHALEHFQANSNTNKHCQSVLASSICDEIGDTFCYKCEEFVQNPFALNIKIKDQEIKNFEDLAGKKDMPCINSNVIGMINEGLTCYASTVVHLLCEILKNTDLTMHFLICDLNPMDCLCCQFIKIQNASKEVQNCIKSVRITGFLNCFYRDHPEFSMKKQEDCSEFLYALLETLKNYENCMLLPPISDLFEYTTVETINCNSCNLSKVDTFKSNILYLNFDKTISRSISKYFEDSEVPCECGGKLKRKLHLKKLPEFLIISLGRYKSGEEGGYVKIEDPIGVEDFEILENDQTKQRFNLQIRGAIVHKGKETTEGHYLWWVKDEDEFYLANDETINKSEMKCAEQGNLFLFSSKQIKN